MSPRTGWMDHRPHQFHGASKEGRVSPSPVGPLTHISTPPFPFIPLSSSSPLLFLHALLNNPPPSLPLPQPPTLTPTPPSHPPPPIECGFSGSVEAGSSS